MNIIIWTKELQAGHGCVYLYKTFFLCLGGAVQKDAFLARKHINNGDKVFSRIKGHFLTYLERPNSVWRSIIRSRSFFCFSLS